MHAGSHRDGANDGWRDDVDRREVLLLAAVLLLAPGFLSDVFALFLLLIPSRAVAQPATATASGPRTMDGEYRRVE